MMMMMTATTTTTTTTTTMTQTTIRIMNSAYNFIFMQSACITLAGELTRLKQFISVNKVKTTIAGNHANAQLNINVQMFTYIYKQV